MASTARLASSCSGPLSPPPQLLLTARTFSAGHHASSRCRAWARAATAERAAQLALQREPPFGCATSNSVCQFVCGGTAIAECCAFGYEFVALRDHVRPIPAGRRAGCADPHSSAIATLLRFECRWGEAAGRLPLSWWVGSLGHSFLSGHSSAISAPYMAS